jgi:hypothetical protein
MSNVATSTKTVRDRLHQIAQGIESTGYVGGSSSFNTTDHEAFRRWRKFYDATMIPLRLEQCVMYANLVNEQNDLNNKNNVLVKTQKEQLDVIDRVIQDYTNKGFTSYKSFQSTDYKMNQKAFQLTYIRIAIMLLSFYSILVGLAILEQISIDTVIYIGTFTSILYIIIMYINMRYNNRRFFYEWDKIYHESAATHDKKKKEAKCQN